MKWPTRAKQRLLERARTKLPPSPSLRYFSPESGAEGGGVRFSFAYNYMLASYEAIWDSVRGCRSRRYADEGVDASLMGFTLESDEYERGLELVSGHDGSAPPIALQFEELLSELKAWDTESLDDDDEGDVSLQGRDGDGSDGEGGEAASLAATFTLRSGRAVKQVDYTGQGA